MGGFGAALGVCEDPAPLLDELAHSVYYSSCFLQSHHKGCPRFSQWAAKGGLR